MEQSIYLTLENGTVFQGKSFGACKPVTGEVVFTTATVSYTHLDVYKRQVRGCLPF